MFTGIFKDSIFSGGLILPPSGDPAGDYAVLWRPAVNDTGIYSDTADYRIGKVGIGGQPVKSVFFDGTYGYSALQTEAGIGIGDGAFSVSFWINGLPEAANRAVISTGTGADARTWVIRMEADGTIALRTTALTRSTTAGFDDGVWHHCVIVSNGAGLGGAWYVDGVEVSTFTMQAYDFTANTFYVGSRATADYFTGNLDDVRIYHRVLNTDEITALYNFTHDFNPLQIADLTAYYDTQDQTTITSSAGAVSQLDDKSTNGLDLVQATALNQPLASRIINGMNVLDYAGNNFLRKESFPVPASGNIMFNFFAKVDTVSFRDESIISMDATNDFQFDANNDAAFNGAIDSSIFSSAATLSSPPHAGESVYTIVFDFSNNITMAYVDGTLYAATNEYTTKLDALQSLKIMSNRVGFSEVDGAFGDLVISEKVDNNTMQRIQGQMAWKYGLQSKLPKSHPYKSNPPKAIV